MKYTLVVITSRVHTVRYVSPTLRFGTFAAPITTEVRVNNYWFIYPNNRFHFEQSINKFIHSINQSIKEAITLLVTSNNHNYGIAKPRSVLILLQHVFHRLVYDAVSNGRSPACHTAASWPTDRPIAGTKIDANNARLENLQSDKTGHVTATTSLHKKKIEGRSR